MILYVHISAPFAVFRPVAAGWYRPTALMLTPSAAYGLILNFAAIDSRVIETDDQHDEKTPATLTKRGLPEAKIAIGRPSCAATPRIQTVVQQLHNYPIGATTGMPKEVAKGNKNNISPVRRELLSDFEVVVGLDADESLCKKVIAGLAGEFNQSRYGLPFLGDNSFLIDSVEILESPPECVWYEVVRKETRTKRRRLASATRLTISVDRTGVSRTRSAVFSPTENTYNEPTPDSWTAVGSG